MHCVSQLSTEDLAELQEIDFWTDDSNEFLELDDTSIRFGAGTPYPAIPRSERQYEGFTWVHV